MNDQAIDIEYLLSTLPSISTPEKGLLAALLERAILDLVGNDQREVEAAQEWIFDETADEDTRFSFSWVCNQLDIDHALFSSKIRCLPKRGKSRIAPWYRQELSSVA